MEALGLYLSIPFCRSKCSFCNFASGVYPVSAMGSYVERMIEDLRNANRWANENGAVLPAAVDSIYLGGGTPSLLPPALMEKLFAEIRSAFKVTADAEITIECAPGQIEDDVLAAMVQSGVNRVSFGVQSFVDREASVTGRLHNRATALEDIRRMQRAGIGAISVDLIAGLPHQTAESWCESLAVIAATGASHASVYMLEVDEDSRLGRELLRGGGRYHADSVPGEDQVADLYERACESFAEQGLVQYEISNFARVGKTSRHNLKYWQRRPYLGMGVDAHSMLRAERGDVLRLSTTDDLQQFLSSSFNPEALRVASTGQLEEAWFLGLRLNGGVNVTELTHEFGTAAIAGYECVLHELQQAGLLEASGERVRLTDKGRLLSNEVFERFLTSETEAVHEELIFIS